MASTVADSRPVSPIEQLPNEIKIMILRQLNSLGTLRCLVLSSPAFHSAYLTAHASILTEITLCTHPVAQILQSASFTEVSTNFRAEPEQVTAAIMAVWRQYEQSGLEGVKLDIEQCVTLLKISEYIPWRVITRGNGVIAKCDRSGIYERSRRGPFWRVYLCCPEQAEEARKTWEEAVREARSRWRHVRLLKGEYIWL